MFFSLALSSRFSGFLRQLNNFDLCLQSILLKTHYYIQDKIFVKILFAVTFTDFLKILTDILYGLCYTNNDHHYLCLEYETMKILLVEDEITLCEMIEESLRAAGYEVDACYDGEEADEQIAAEQYDLIILDLNLPGMDGMELLRRIRSFDRETRVLILSARSTVTDKVEGLDAGANDYMSKPFHLDELIARIRSLTRRQFIQQDVQLTAGELTFDTKARAARVQETSISLTRKETGVLEYLMLNKGRPISQEELIEHVWDGSVDSFSNSIRVHMSSLRKKLRSALGYDPILNHIGEGYEIKEKRK